MASPIGYLIHPDPPPAPPPPPQNPAFHIPPAIANPAHNPASGRAGFHTPLSVTSAPSVPSNGPAPAPPSLTRPDLEHRTSTPDLSGNHNKTQSLYQCADCLRRYSRPEHLQRHIASHTLGKRFTCEICSKGFARADLLKRHRANHKDDSGGSKRRRFNSVPSASRVAQACAPCAKARVKCEEIKPCTRCKNRGLPCEVASSEDAALYLVHLSGNRAGHQDAGQPQHQLPAAVTSSSFMQSASPEDNKEGIATPVYAAYKQEAQLPTPETSSAPVDQSIPGNFRSYPPHDDMAYEGQEQARAPFPDFLRDVLYDQSLGNPARLPEAPQGPAVLDFCDDANLDFKDFDFSLLDHWNFDLARGTANQTTSSEGPVNMTAMRSALAQIWTESPWRWTPGKTDNRYTEQSNLPLPSNDAHTHQIHDNQTPVDRVAKEKLHLSCRDKILAIVLGTCRESRMANRVASSFPSVDMIDSWINIFLAARLCHVSSWVHYGSFSLNSMCPEWLATAAAAGAVLTPVPAFRSFGFALQESIQNNKAIAEIDKVQALVLLQDVGLWSGNRRKMEIAECRKTDSSKMAMMRYRGKFGRSAYSDMVIYPSDEGKVLEEKWKRWYQLESWKRLVFHAYLRDAQVSMTQLNNPAMSYAELTLPLPCSKELWFARTAQEFKTRYLESAAAGDTKSPPSLSDLLRDINALPANPHRLDMQFSISIYLHGFWSLIWELRQLSSIHSTSSNKTTTTLLLDSRRTDLQSQLKTFHLLTRSWHEHEHENNNNVLVISLQETLLLHLLSLNLHASLPDLQLFAGKEGEDPARRVYPSLQRWAASADARQALWHTGQILRQARRFPRGHLKDFWSVAVCHGALCLWTFGVVTRAGVCGGGPGGGGPGQRLLPPPPPQGVGVVYLDGEQEGQEGEGEGDVQGWIAFGQQQQGRPAIHGLGSGGGACLIEEPRACVEVAQEILRANFVGGWESLPPLSENIISVLKELEKGAWAVGMG
ncbi:zinc finger protein klf1 [Chaetomidium leptoderma]|uniref:Zinc finger protein klf1 n=1 Tax=Chaetomidium leptoderma TaxID=669021 RepID=A0AAN6VWD3_9PEZI|nr:zinc finger protein klf1 [Chaetomidium leptoderma]